VDRLIRFDAVFTRLLFDDRARCHLEAGEWDALGVDGEARDDLARLDPAQLRHVVALIRRGLADGSLGGMGIVDHFPRTLEHLAPGGYDAEAVMARFTRSKAFGDVNCLGLSAAGISTVEGFFTWAQSELSGASAHALLQLEFATAMMKLLAPTPDPAFTVRSPLIRRLPRGHLAVLDHRAALPDPDARPASPYLVAAVSNRYVEGRVGDVVAATLLRRTATPPPWATETLARCPAMAEEAAAALSRRGLL
jgi:hypothetical protein